jgi:hypothetical protein
MLPALLSIALFAPVGRVEGLLSCLNGHPTVEAEFASREGVFVGTVRSEGVESPAADGHFDDGTTYIVKVDEVLRGRLPKTVRIFSENSSGRFPMEPRRKYLLFVYTEHGRMIVDSCGNSEPFNPDSETLKTAKRLAAQP